MEMYNMEEAMKTILLVDDEPLILDSIGEILRWSRYDVITRLDGESALSYVNGGNPVDLVITDYLLPGMTGLDLFMAIRRRKPDFPLIFFTGHGTIEIYLKAIALGVFKYLNKPVRTKDLIRTVEAALRNTQTGGAANDTS
jgi:DNA-binding NtrC family response regulator